MKKRLIILSAFLSPYRSGAEAMVEEVSQRLANDFDITIVTGRYSRSLPSSEIRNGVKILRVGLGCSLDKWLYPFLAPLRLGALKPDIIHAVLETFAGLALLFCRCHAKKILTLQTTNRSFLKGPILRFPDTVTAISSELQRIAEQYGRKDVVVIPNGIDLSAINTASRTYAKDSGRILFVGRLESMKGVDTLLRAYAHAIKGLDPAIRLRIVGSGSEEKALKKLAADLDIEHRVTFTGRISGERLFEEYARAEIFCGLSRSEALGNVFLESQAAGCALLATNVGGIPEIVKDGETGILVPVDNPDVAAAQLRHLLSDPALRARLSNAARKNAQKYGWDGIAEQYRQQLTK